MASGNPRLGVGIVRYDIVNRVLWWDAKAAAIFGDDGSLPPLLQWRERVHPDDIDVVRRMFGDTAGSVGAECVFRIVLPDRSTRYILTRSIDVTVDESGVPAELTGVVIELGHLTGQDAQLASLLDRVGLGFMALDEDLRIIYVNSGCLRHVRRSRDEMLGRVVTDVLPETRGSYFDALCRKVLATGREHQTRVDSLYSPGTTIEVTAAADSGALVVHFRDVTAEVTAQQQADEAHALLLHEARHDSLTGLLNRAAITEHLQRLVEPGAGPAVVMFLDVDGFKDVNDTRGQRVGDRILQAVSEHLSRAMRAPAVVGRLGGDEFVAILPEAGDIDVEKVVTLMVSSITTPIDVGDELLVVTISVGMARSTSAHTVDELLHHADTALYAAKRLGGNTAVWHAQTT
ncbi:sensor domain-containing diguanylate cyclase [Rhodococcus jostii]|uniref:Diguanylate cyclase (GGDEF) domain-containing protein n=1 Tax=Rhodococcus jostii TaxID=132919 RepID=A0A1H4ZPV4_RHOJO|nr:sensor domain-containing diguanylate cyclase [Rhodococcus jostii]SED31698.1 diguanylate cyclase (GGDEF) domain-containing protein [Rhodococcus jostii]